MMSRWLFGFRVSRKLEQMASLFSFPAMSNSIFAPTWKAIMPD